MADVHELSIKSPSAMAKRKWGLGEFALGLVGLVIFSAFIAMLLDYQRSEGVVSSWASLEQPNYFRPSPNEVLFVKRTLVEGAVEKGAVCLDGSAPSYHLHRGHGSGKNNWLVHLEGGGWCSSTQACFLRSRAGLGSSFMMEESVMFAGSLSNSPLKNPDFYNWNRVKVRYCDGGSYSGDVEVPTELKDDDLNEVKKIYYRGQKVWQAVIDDLLSKGMLNVEKALLSGCSAGGLGSILHCNDFRDQLPKNAIVKCLSDGGFFLDVQDVSNKSTIQSFYKDVVSLHGINSRLPLSCRSEMDAERCFFPQYLLKTIKSPLFILNPAYDTWQIDNVLVPPSADPSGKWNFCKTNPASCSNEQLKILQDFRVKLLEAIDPVEGSDDGGLFINSCFIHCQSEHDVTWHRAEAPRVNKRTIAETVGDWYFKRRPAKDIDCAYPCNPSCFKIGVWGS